MPSLERQKSGEPLLRFAADAVTRWHRQRDSPQTARLDLLDQDASVGLPLDRFQGETAVHIHLDALVRVLRIAHLARRHAWFAILAKQVEGRVLDPCSVDEAEPRACPDQS